MKINQKIILLLFFFLTGPIFAKCIDGKVKWLEEGKEKQESLSYCFKKTGKVHSWITKACLKKKSNCKANLASDSKVPKFSLRSTVGNPMFHACHRVGGLPQIAQYWDGTKWIDFRRCIFDDNSSIDLATIFHNYKSGIK